MSGDNEYHENTSTQPEEPYIPPEIDEVIEEEHTEGFADSIISILSPEGNVSRVTKLTKLPPHIVTYVVAAICFVIGVLCVTITDRLTEVLPYLVGGVMVVLGGVRFIVALCQHEYRHTKTNRTAMSLVVLGLGTMIIVQHVMPNNSSAITFIAVVWGILGLFEGGHALNHAFKRIANSERCVYFLIKGIVELVVAFLLLYNPGNHEIHHFHIIVFGLNLILDSITMIPQVKAFLSTK